MATLIPPAALPTGSEPSRERTVFSLELPPTTQAPHGARSWLAETFAAELDGLELDRAKLLLSELVMNAVVHGSGSVELYARLDQDRLRVEVIDGGPGFTRSARDGDLDAIGGLGLRIVDAEASRWAIRPGAGEVWFEIQRG